MRAIAAVVAAAATTACAGTAFDRHFDARRWEDAADAFAQDSALQQRERAIYRAAIVYGTPASDAYDPVRARQLLERLIDEHPRSPRLVEATAILALLYEVQRGDHERLRIQREMDRRVGELTREIATLQEHIDWVESQLAERVEEATTLRTLAASLTADLRQRDARLRALQQELDRLKEIDLSPTGRPPTGGNGAGRDARPPGGEPAGPLFR